MILITKTFKKSLIKIKSIGVGEIITEINKHKSGLSNFIEIGVLKNRKILKGYLLHKKVRILILFGEKKGNYLPFYIVKKETKNGKNITKDSLNGLYGNLDKIFEDLERNNFDIIK